MVLIGQDLRYEWFDSAANMVNCEGWVDVTTRHAACEITDYATEITNHLQFDLSQLNLIFITKHSNF
jgi:hypothetical protein